MPEGLPGEVLGGESLAGGDINGPAALISTGAVVSAVPTCKIKATAYILGGGVAVASILPSIDPQSYPLPGETLVGAFEKITPAALLSTGSRAQAQVTVIFTIHAFAKAVCGGGAVGGFSSIEPPPPRGGLDIIVGYSRGSSLTFAS